MYPFLRMQNIYGQPPMMGNDLPSQGGITGNMPPIAMPPLGSPDGSGINPALASSMMQPQPPAMPPQGEVPPSLVPNAPGDEYDAGARMRELYSPHTEATDRFNKLAANYPHVEPSRGRRLIGSLISAGTYLSRGDRPGNEVEDIIRSSSLGNKVVEDPERKAIEEWKNQIGPAQQGATLERYENTNNRTLAYQTVAQELRDQAQKHKEEYDQTRAQIAENRARTYDFKARNPGLKFNFTGPTVTAANPITGEVKDLGIPTGHMTEMDKLNLQNDNAMFQIGAKQEGAEKIEGMKEKSKKDVADEGGWSIGSIPDPEDPTKQIGVRVNARTGAVEKINLGGKPIGPVNKPSSLGAGGGGKGETPFQTRVRQFNIARQLFNTRPDLKPFIKLGSPNAADFMINPPGKTGIFGTGDFDPKQKALYDEVNQAIYGDTTPGMAASHVQTPSTPTGSQNKPATPQQNVAPNAPKAPAGWKYVPKPGGGWTAVPDPSNKG